MGCEIKSQDAKPHRDMINDTNSHSKSENMLFACWFISLLMYMGKFAREMYRGSFGIQIKHQNRPFQIVVSRGISFGEKVKTVFKIHFTE